DYFLHLQVYFTCDAYDLGALIRPVRIGPDRVRHVPFKKIRIIRAAGCDDDNRTAVPYRQKRGNWSNCGTFSEKLHPESPAGALVGKHANGFPLTQKAFQRE